MSEGWIKLSDEQPTIGMLCKWWVVDGKVDDMGEGSYICVTTTINGKDVGARGFSTSKGIMFSPPEHTFWKEQN